MNLDPNVNDQLKPEEATLESWKEIAEYLQRNTTTARRWEREEGLPVHRHSHKSRASVYAFPSEIDAWRASRKLAAEPPPPLPLWKTLLAPPRSLAFGVTLALCLMMVGNGIRPQVASAQEVSRRRVWTGPTVDRDASLSRDGRYFAFLKKDDDVYIRDAATGTERRVTNQAEATVCTGKADVPRISRDGRWVVYGVWNKDEWFELCIVGANGEPSPRRLYFSREVPFIEPVDWSPDGTRIAVSYSTRDQVSRIALLSVSDGSLRVLKSVGWGGANSIEFSPDGKYLAYDLMRGDDLEGRDVFVLAADGTSETLLVNAGFNSVLGWSADGKRVLFLKERSGNLDIWAAPVEGGNPQGAPTRVLANSGNMAPNGLTETDALYYAIAGGRGQEIHIAELDLSGARLSPVGGGTPGTIPQWSPDGKYVAFLANRPRLRMGASTLAIRALNGGDVRYLRQTFSYIGAFRWAPDGRSFAVWGNVPRGRYGIYSVDAQSGDVSQIVVSPGDFVEVVAPLNWSPDQRKLYYTRRSFRDDKLEHVDIMERDLQSGTERELARMPNIPTVLAISPDGKNLYFRRQIQEERTVAFFSINVASGKATELVRGVAGLNLSPDGRYIATVAAGAAVLIPTIGGATKELLRVDRPQAVRIAAWAPDSESVILNVGSGESQGELWRVPVSGGNPQKTGINFPSSTGMLMNPDGRHVAYLESGPAGETEMWVLENFLPAATGK